MAGCGPHDRRRHRPGQPHRARKRGADVGAALRPADARAAGRGRRRPRRPVRPRPVLRRRQLLLAAGRAHPQPRRAAGGAAAGKPPPRRRVHRPDGWTRSTSSPGSSPSPSTTPSCTPRSAGSPASRRRCGGWRRWWPRRRRRRTSSPRSPRRPGGCWEWTSRSWSGTTRKTRSRWSARGPARVPPRRPRSAASCRWAGRTYHAGVPDRPGGADRLRRRVGRAR